MSDFELGGKVCVVTGAGRGIGRGIAESLARHGATVVLVGRTAATLAAAAAAIGAGASTQVADVGREADVLALREAVLARHGRIDVLVNNAATGADGLLTLTREADIHRQIALNLESTILLTRACLKAMLAERSGAIVNISSINALRGHQGVSVYSATKAALIGLTKSLAVEVGPEGIRVNCVAPGYFDSEMTGGFTDEQRQRIVRRTPLRRLGTVADVAAAVRFFLSPEASFLTGQILAVDGGYTC